MKNETPPFDYQIIPGEKPSAVLWIWIMTKPKTRLRWFELQLEKAWAVKNNKEK